MECLGSRRLVSGEYDIVRVAKNRELGVTIKRISKDFGVQPMTLLKWLQRAAVDGAAKPGQTRAEKQNCVKLESGSGC